MISGRTCRACRIATLVHHENGTPMGANAGATVTMLPGFLAAGYFATIPLIGAADKPPGTYNVRARCNTVIAACACSVPEFRNGHLNVWAVGN
jgi:hypothetical protein